MHWTEKNRAIANLGVALERQGWTLYGWSPDRSDPMSDYYCPASWSGIAALGDALVAANWNTRGRVNLSSGTVSGSTCIPIVQATPKGSIWHVERGGEIIAKGIGLAPLASYSAESKAAADELATKITRAATPASTSVPVSELTVSDNEDKGGIEIRFPSKPAPDVLAWLKARGWRWSRLSGCWYKPAGDAARAEAAGLMAQAAQAALGNLGLVDWKGAGI